MNKSMQLILFIVLTGFFCRAQNTITWTLGTNISANSFGNLHPRITLDQSGNPMVIWGRMADESVFFSRWNGSAFTSPVKLNPSWLSIATASWMGPDIASKGDTVYIVMKRTPEALDTNYIYLIASFNGGVSFSSPVRVDFIADSISRFPTVAVDATGNPIVAFMKFNASFVDSRWVVTKSMDYGGTFAPDVRASGWSGAGAEVCDCCPGAIISSGNFSAMLYRDNLSNIRDMWAGISVNSSSSFTSGFAVDNNNWMLMMCPSSGPDGVIIGDSLYSVFMNGGSGMNRTYLSTSSISSGAANSITPLTSNIAGLSQQNFPRIASDGMAMAVVWRQTVSGSVQLSVLLTSNIANGLPVAFDTVDLNDVTNTDVAISNGNIFVVWQDDNSGTVKFRKGIYSTLGTSVIETSGNYFSVSPNPVTTSHIQVQLKSDIIKMVTFEMTDELARPLMKQNIKAENGKFNVDVSGLKAGVYFLKIKSEKESFVKKVIKY